MKKTFKRMLRIKDCPEDFGLGIGIIAEEEITYWLKKAEFDSALFAHQMIMDGMKMIEDNIEVILEQVDN